MQRRTRARWAQTTMVTTLHKNFKLGCIHIHPTALGDFQEHMETATRGLFRGLLSCWYPVKCKSWSLIYRKIVGESHNIYSLQPTLIVAESPELMQWYSLSPKCLFLYLFQPFTYSLEIKCVGEETGVLFEAAFTIMHPTVLVMCIECPPSVKCVLWESREKPSPPGNTSRVTKMYMTQIHGNSFFLIVIFCVNFWKKKNVLYTKSLFYGEKCILCINRSKAKGKVM